MARFTMLWGCSLFFGAFSLLLTISPPQAMARSHWSLVVLPAIEPGNVFFTDVRHGVVIGSETGPGRSAIEWTKDSGHSWHPAKIKTDMKGAALSGLWFSSTKLGWVGGPIRSAAGSWSGKCILLQTKDGGRVWRPQAVPPSITFIKSVWFGPHGKHGRILPWSGTIIWQTTDGGKAWKSVSVGHSFGPASWLGSWKNIALGGTAGDVLISTDAGKKWTKIATGLEGPAARLTAISFAKGGQVGWAVGSQGKWLRYPQPAKPVILHTVDGGKTWTLQTPPRGQTGPLTDVWAVSPTQAWVSSYLGYAAANPASALPWLLHTTNGGKKWRDELRHVLSIRKLFFLNARHGWAVGGQGGSSYEPFGGAMLIYGGR